ncbi:MAG: FHA domain-containing protein [Phycisphaerae bacterium]|nr:FHA domain-containing protein [Phycisphaerae bacterium]
MTVALVTFGKKGVRKDFALETGPLVIGRKIDAALRIPVAEVSRSHCEITVNGSKVTLRDLGSSNGTFVNDQKVAQAALKPGDRVKIGPVIFTVQIDGIPEHISPDAPVPAASEAPTRASPAPESPEDTDDFDIDELGELDIDDLSDLDLDDLGGPGGPGDADDLEEIDDLDEIDESDLIADDSPGENRPA